MDVTNEELKVLIEQLIEDLKVNTEINKELMLLLKTNNGHTKDIYDYVSVQLSPSQQAKDFLINVGANLVGNSITVPTIVNGKAIFGQ